MNYTQELIQNLTDDRNELLKQNTELNKRTIEFRDIILDLEEETVLLDLFLKHCPMYTFFKDENINVVRLSSNFEAMLGKPIVEMLGKNMFDLFPHELAHKITNDDRRVFEHNIPITIEEKFNDKIYSTTKFPISRPGKKNY